MLLSDAAPFAAVTTRELLAGLRRHHLPATGFVIGEKLEGDKAWVMRNVGQLVDAVRIHPRRVEQEDERWPPSQKLQGGLAIPGDRLGGVVE